MHKIIMSIYQYSYTKHLFLYGNYPFITIPAKLISCRDYSYLPYSPS